MSDGRLEETAPAAQSAGERAVREARQWASNARVWGYVIYVACSALAAVGIVATAWGVASTLAHDSERIAWSGLGIMAVVIVGIWAAGRAALHFLSAR
jgi:hypothetical protein